MTQKARNALISVFAAVWLFVFTYESTRALYLNPFFNTELPKVKFLFPPAGWIMFYRVDETDGRAEVFGQKGETLEFIDPHRIFDNRWIGYDNIRRNVLVTVLHPAYAEPFCRYLKRKFPEYDAFAVFQVIYPSVTKYPGKRFIRTAYRCP